MGKPLVIVESPAKARTISRFLGSDYTVQASIGHVRDLPTRASEVPARYRKEKWARLAVDVDNGFKPLYVLTTRGREQVKKLKEQLAGAPALYLATDEDREGEAIAWHLVQVLKPKVPVYRLVFHEITSSAIKAALDAPRELDLDLVKAQETRRIVDRLVGYDVSELLWRKVKQGLSAGRVQSVAVRLTVQRERERMAFVSGDWWDLSAHFSCDAGGWDGRLVELDGTRLAIAKDFDTKTGQPKARAKVVLLDEQAAKDLAERVAAGSARVRSVERKEFKERPLPPFTTSSLQQEANRRFRWTARRTMGVAQRLYENGWITYMRTDSTFLSDQALTAARTTIRKDYGPAFLPPKPRLYKSKAKGAQEAHEAIRPAGETVRPTAACRKAMDDECGRLYDLIRKRTLASQMSDALGLRMTVDTIVDPTGAVFRSKGKAYTFEGFRRAFVASSDDAVPSKGLLPDVREGQPAEVSDVLADGHTTQPPPRLNEATLIKELEARGIGRPSTYASILSTIQDRGYVFKRSNALVPTWTAFAVTNLMESHFSALVDYDFTAQLEDGLDSIAVGRLDNLRYLEDFYRGRENGGSVVHAGLVELLERAQDAANPREICTFQLGEVEGKPVVARVGRYGPYLAYEDQTRSIPEDLPPDELDMSKALALLAETPEGPKVLGQDPESGLDVSLLVGRFGPYVQLGEQKKGSKKKPPRSSLLKGMTPADIDLALALALLSLPRTLGKNPEGEDVKACNGPYGPYVQADKKRVSLPEGVSPLEVGLDQALEVLANPPRRRRSNTVISELGEDPEGRKVVVRNGRFGPYVTDGEVNATLRKGTAPETVELAQALEMLQKKRDAPARPKRRRSSARKTTRSKAASTKKAPARKKKTTRRKAPAKSS